MTAPSLIARIPGSLPALRSRNFRLFIIGQLISYTGSWLQTVAQGWLVLQLSNSAFIVGLVTALGALPILLFTLYGGVLADRVNRRKTVMILQALLAVEALALAILVVLNHVTVRMDHGARALHRAGDGVRGADPAGDGGGAVGAGVADERDRAAVVGVQPGAGAGAGVRGRDHRRVGRGGVLLPQRGELPRGDLGIVADGPGRLADRRRAAWT